MVITMNEKQFLFIQVFTFVMDTHTLIQLSNNPNQTMFDFNKPLLHLINQFSPEIEAMENPTVEDCVHVINCNYNYIQAQMNLILDDL